MSDTNPAPKKAKIDLKRADHNTIVNMNNNMNNFYKTRINFYPILKYKAHFKSCKI